MPTRQPNSRQCFVCGVENPVGLGLKFIEESPGEVSVDYTVDERYQGYPGIVHGGIVAAMLDEIAGRTVMGDSRHPRFMFTARLDIRYRKNVPVGKPLHLTSKLDKDRGRTATAKSAIFDETGTLLADCEALLVTVPDEMVNQVDLEALGWRIYN